MNHRVTNYVSLFSSIFFLTTKKLPGEGKLKKLKQYFDGKEVNVQASHPPLLESHRQTIQRSERKELHITYFVILF